MPLYLNTKGNANLGIGICDRCRMKRALVQLRPDGDIPGLKVCQDPGCYDELDPYKLAPRQMETISLPFVRPDAPLDRLAVEVNYLTPQYIAPLIQVMNPPTARRELILEIGAMIYDAGIWDKLDVLWFPANYSETAANFNWINPDTALLSPQGGYTFSTNVGYEGDGATAYVSTGYVPGSGHYGLNSATVFFRAIGAVTEAGTADVVNITGGGRTSVVRMFAAPSTAGSIGINTLGSIGTNYPTPEGFFAIRRADNASVELFIDGVQVDTTATVATGLPTQEMTLLAAVEAGIPDRFSSKTIGIAGAGEGLTSDDLSTLNTIFDAWLTAVGAI